MAHSKKVSDTLYSDITLAPLQYAETKNVHIGYTSFSSAKIYVNTDYNIMQVHNLPTVEFLLNRVLTLR